MPQNFYICGIEYYLKMKTIIYLLALALLVTTYSCNSPSPTEKALKTAESIMEESPDSALIILTNIDKKSLKSGKENALFALLYSQALHKNDIYDDVDSLISTAVNYYKTHKDQYMLMKALFYSGANKYNHNDIPSAIIRATNSHDIAKSINDYYWRAKSAELIEDIQNASLNHDEIVSYAYEAATYYLKANKIRNHRFAVCDYAVALSNIEESDNSLKMLDSIQAIAAQEPIDSLLNAYAQHALLQILVKEQKYDRAQIVMNEMYKYVHIFPISSIELSYFANIETHYNRFENTLKLLSQAKENAQTRLDTIGILYAQSLYYKKNNDYRNQAIFTDSIYNSQNNELKKIIQQSAVLQQRDYYNKIATERQQETERLHTYIIIIITITFFIIVAILVINHYRIKYKEILLESKMNELLRNANLKSHTIIEKLFKEKYEILNMLCSEYYLKGDSPNTRTLILKEIEQEIDKIKGGKSMEDIAKSVDKYMDNIVSRLKDQCSFFKDEDITFISLIYAGFSPRSICLLTGIKQANYYKKRERLIKRIATSDAINKEEFVQKLQCQK